MTIDYHEKIKLIILFQWTWKSCSVRTRYRSLTDAASTQAVSTLLPKVVFYSEKLEGNRRLVGQAYLPWALSAWDLRCFFFKDILVFKKKHRRSRAVDPTSWERLASSAKAGKGSKKPVEGPKKPAEGTSAPPSSSTHPQRPCPALL